jgi:PKD repeat protein
VTTTAASSVAEPQTNVEAVYCKNQHVVIDVTNANSHNNWYNESSFLLTDSPSFEIDTLKATTQLYIEAVDVNGCKTAKKLVTINMDPIAANFTVSDNNIKVAEITSVASTSTGVISSYFWDMGNGMEYNSANAAVYYNTPGIFSIQLKIVSENGCKDSLTLENAVRVNRSSNTSEISKEDLFIYPSRISNVLTIEYSGEPGATAFVYSSEGKLLREQKLTGNKNQMDLSSLNPGSYFIKITTNSGDDYIRNFIKTR